MATKRVYKVQSLDTADFNSNPDLIGFIVEFGSIKVKDDERSFMVVDTGIQKVRVFHSTALDDAFKLGSAGDHIHIAFRGKVKIEGGHTFNRFEVQVWTEEEGGDEEKKEGAPF